MKRLITTLTLLYSLTTLAQISIGNIEKQTTPIVTKPKPKVIDSMSDFHHETDFKNYAQYVGHLFYLPPKTGSTNAQQEPILWAIYPKKGNDPANNYYKLMNGTTDTKLKELLKDGNIYNYHTESSSSVIFSPNLLKRNYFIFRNEKDGDTLYWSPDYYREDKGAFILVPYFAKQKALYEKKNFIYEGPSNSTEKEIVNTDRPKIYVEKNSKWTCKEVTLLKESQVFDYVPEDKYSICYVFTNDKNETFARTVNPFYPKVRDDGADYHLKCFISEDEYMKNEEARKNDEQKLQLKNDAEKAKQKQDEIAKQQDFVKRFGQANADLIKNHKVKIGMTKEMCVYSWGPYFTPSKTVNDQGVFETYQYSLTQALYFKDGILIQSEQ